MLAASEDQNLACGLKIGCSLFSHPSIGFKGLSGKLLLNLLSESRSKVGLEGFGYQKNVRSYLNNDESTNLLPDDQNISQPYWRCVL